MKFIKEFLVIGLVLATAGCGRNTAPQQLPNGAEPAAPTKQVARIDPLTLALVPQEGDGITDWEIRRYQDLVRKGENRAESLEKLGWLFVAKARETFDPGYYKLAGACGDVLDADSPSCPQSLLLRGYVLENLHQFKEAEPLARELVAKRGSPFDYGLLGDSLMEQGKLNEAVAAYQSMVNLRPDLQSYARVAHIRWLRGDTEGALEVMRAAVSASSPRDPDSAAWVSTRLAALEFQSGKTEAAQSSAAMALGVRPNYPPALLLRGRMLLAEDQFDEAIESLEAATKLNPLPEYQWALAEALRAAEREPEAVEVESRLQAFGDANDPRTLSLFLATSGQDAATALRLAETEMQQRQDVFTQDTLAWALAASGRIVEAQQHMSLAVAEGTEDARLLFHAAVIAQQAGQVDEAEKWFVRAAGSMQALLPSERARLLQLAEDFPTDGEIASMTTAKDSPTSNVPTEK